MALLHILLQSPPANQNLWINLAVVLIATILFILTIYLYIKLRTKNYERERMLLEEKVNVRTKQLIEQNIELEKLSIVASRTDNAVLIIDADEKIEWTNAAFSRMRWNDSTCANSQLIGKKISETNFYPDIRKDLDECLSQKKSVRFESSISHSSGNRRWVSSLLTPIFEDDVLKKFVVVDTDISPNKELEEKLKSSLNEKEILLREIHHRVKNNLQVIISLLNLQSGYIHDEETLRAVKEGENRVRSMALVHEKFYQSEGISEIDFAEYVEKLCQYIFQSFPEAASRVKLTVESDNVAFDLDTAMPCGLLINEIVSNSLKYAFPDGQEGEIIIRLKISGENEINISVQDNGKGIPEEYDLKNPTTLGLQLIDALTSQLNGEVEMHRNGGTIFNITFTYPR
ncbi:MAG TPA: histidine kinase dimerization/phosphoacceptor domain -containing protein [Bacteroidia bacterium]|nr:histidine kinase dimerization/phosphoacceptor domain -containing protein [Bacteroidia bacterium]